jgi:hypothetical protein
MTFASNPLGGSKAVFGGFDSHALPPVIHLDIFNGKSASILIATVSLLTVLMLQRHIKSALDCGKNGRNAKNY